jgi:hypothetical protein
MKRQKTIFIVKMAAVIAAAFWFWGAHMSYASTLYQDPSVLLYMPLGTSTVELSHGYTINGYNLSFSGTSASFNGSNSYIQGNAFTGGYGNSSGTISVWVNTTYGTLEEITGNENQGNNASNYLRIFIYNHVVCVDAPPGTRICGSKVVDDGSNHLITVTYIDAVSLDLYVDGILDNSGATPSLNPDQTQICIGVNYDAGGPYWPYNGTMWDFATWNRALTSTEVNSLLTGGGAGAPTPSITLYAPTSTVPDFQNWVVSEINAPTSSSYLSVQYGLSSSSFTYNDTASFSPFVSSNPTAVTKRNALWFPPLTVPATWYAEAYLLDYNSAVIATSSLETFSIDPNAPPPAASTSSILAVFGSVSSGETSSTIVTTVNCQITSSSFFADPVGNIQNGICNALTFLFVPNSAQQIDMSNRFNSLGTQVKNKPPFGYFTSAETALTSFQNNGTSTLISTSTAAAFGGIFGLLDDGIAVILWFGFALWIIRTFRNLNT